MNDRYTRQALKPWAQAMSVLPSVNEEVEKPETKAQRLAREKAEHEAKQIAEPGPRRARDLGDL